MTAEIIVMNKMAIALAADSAVTFRENSGTAQKQKIYQTANKLFMLSKYHPVGIMIYGSSEINEIPWEVVIKIYRNKLGNTSFDKLSEYLSNFLAFLNTYFTEEDQTRALTNKLLRFYFMAIRRKVDKIVSESVDNQTPLDPKGFKKFFNSLILDNYKRLNNEKFVDGIDISFVKRLQEKHHDLICKIIDEVFISLPMDVRAFNKLIDIAGMYFAKLLFPQESSGLVISGYGNIAHFPSMFNISIDCVVESKTKYWIKDSYDINSDKPSLVLPFAVEDTADTFLYGINPKYEQFINDFITGVMEQYPKILVDKIPFENDAIKNNTLTILNEESKGILDNFREELNKYKIENHLIPIRSAVNVMPMDELASLAEMLVNLTSVHKRISMQDEIVGGPIDVAMISKSDGFVWIKRKHYFDPHLNHHFFDNYYNDCKKENEND